MCRELNIVGVATKASSVACRLCHNYTFANNAILEVAPKLRASEKRKAKLRSHTHSCIAVAPQYYLWSECKVASYHFCKRTRIPSLTLL